MRQSEIDEQNDHMVKRQDRFRAAADIVTDALAEFEEVEAVAVIGSVADPLWKEVPRFREFRREGIAVWHECGLLDLAVWVSSRKRLSEMRRAYSRALTAAYNAGTGPSVPGTEVEIVLFEPETDRYLGHLCHFSECPKEKPACFVPGCGDPPFNRLYSDFVPRRQMLAFAGESMLYRRGQGRLMSALDLPPPEEVPDR